MAFDAVDADLSQSLDEEELLDIMSEMAEEMNVKYPSAMDIKCVLK